MHPRPHAPLPFVGRDAELGALVDLLDTAATGTPQLAVVRGPAGIGKTRLADELLRAAQARGWQVGNGRGWADGEAPDLWPWRNILRGLELPESAVDASVAGGRFARFACVLEQLREAARTAPVLIVLDDAQDADAASVRLATFLSRERDLPLALVLLERDGAASPGAGDRQPVPAGDALIVELAGLTDAAAARMLATATGALLDERLVRAARAVTRGNPLHLRSLATRMAGSAGGLEVGLERAIADLVAQLDDAERRRLAVAALLGSEAPIASIATLAGDDPGGVAAALARAADLGLVTLDGEHARVVHDAVREAAVAMLPRANRLALHARAAALLVGSAPDVVARRAHHAIEAAPASTDAAARAVVTLREAAALLGRTSGFETAAALLARASAIHAAASPAAPSAALAVEHAEAVLACGRLTDSRDLFRHAARSAEREGDARALAQAALGLGGMWISEHRLASEADAVRALQQRALDGLPAGDQVLRARLAVRLAAEASYRGSSIAPVLAALEDVRATGDARALAEALSLAHHALLTPEHVGRRLVIAIELIAAATNADDDLLALVGVCWRAVDLFALGHPRAAAALDELRARAEALGCRSLSFIARAIDVMLAIRAGAFDRAEADAAACVALGREVGDADALAYHGAHLAAIRYFQGREAELVDLTSAIASSATLVEQRERAFASAAALFACRAGHPEPGRALLARITRDGIASVPVSSSWLTTVAGIAELSLLLDDVAVAQAAYGALLRHAHLPVMASLAIVCFGSVHRPLALAAQACGHLDLAITHFRAAVAANDEIGHRPAAVLCRAELGLAHLRRRSGDDDTIGRRLVSDAIADAERLGMDALAARWRAATPPLPRAGDALVDVGMARLDGGRWRITVASHIATVPDRVGLGYLSELVAAPDRSIPALALVLQAPTVPETRDSVLDGKAAAAIRQRVTVLRGTPDPSTDEREELAALTRELARAIGLGGRLRAFADAPERARTAVRKAIKRALEEIGSANATVGRHLADRVETGTMCCYHRRPTTAPPSNARSR